MTRRRPTDAALRAPSRQVFQLACLAPLRASGQVSFWKGAPPPQYAGATYLPLEVLRRCAVLAGAFMAYLLVGMLAVDGVNVPMYTTLRRTAVAFTMCAEYLLAGQRFGRPVVAAVAVIVAGSLVAGAADMDFNPVGYGWVFAANAATAVYLSVIARLSRQLPLSSFGLMWANAVLCMPGLTAWLYFSGEAAAVARFEHLHETDFQAALLGSCGLAFVINFAIFLNTQLNTAVTQSVCGNLKVRTHASSTRLARLAGIALTRIYPVAHSRGRTLAPSSLVSSPSAASGWWRPTCWASQSQLQGRCTTHTSSSVHQ